MSGSYDDMMGSPMDPSDHPSHNIPQATQHFAGDVLPIRVPSNDNVAQEKTPLSDFLSLSNDLFPRSPTPLTSIPGGKK